MGEATPKEGLKDSVGSTMITSTIKRLRLVIVEMVIVNELPFRVMEGQVFRKVCCSLEPRFKVPCRNMVVRNWMKLLGIGKGKL